MKVTSDGQNEQKLFSVMLTEGEALELIEGLAGQLRLRGNNIVGRPEFQSGSGECFTIFVNFNSQGAKHD